MYGKLFQLQEETLKTLANQKRLEIVQLLKNGELTVSEMIDMLGINQSNLSQHLAILRRFRIVTTRKDGQYIFYRLGDPHIVEMISELRAFLEVEYANEPAIAKLGQLNNPFLYPIVNDPVCGMRLGQSEAFASASHEGSTYYFCASGCYQSFVSHPSRYVNKLKEA